MMSQYHSKMFDQEQSDVCSLDSDWYNILVDSEDNNDFEDLNKISLKKTEKDGGKSDDVDNHIKGSPASVISLSSDSTNNSSNNFSRQYESEVQDECDILSNTSTNRELSQVAPVSGFPMSSDMRNRVRSAILVPTENATNEPSRVESQPDENQNSWIIESFNNIRNFIETSVPIIFLEAGCMLLLFGFVSIPLVYFLYWIKSFFPESPAFMYDHIYFYKGVEPEVHLSPSGKFIVDFDRGIAIPYDGSDISFTLSYWWLQTQSWYTMAKITVKNDYTHNYMKATNFSHHFLNSWRQKQDTLLTTLSEQVDHITQSISDSLFDLFENT